MTDGYYVDVKEIGKNIRHRRDEKKMTLDQLSELTQLGGKSLLSKYENGQTPRLTVDALLRIADALECEPDYLVGRIPHPNRTTSEISEQIPLSREAIESLRTLKENIPSRSAEDADLILGIINSLIIDVVDSFLVRTIVEDAGKTADDVGMITRQQIKLKKPKLDDAVLVQLDYIPNGIFADAVKLSDAYKMIVNAYAVDKKIEEGDFFGTLGLEYDYSNLAEIAAIGLKTTIGTRLSKIVGSAVRKLTDPESMIPKNIDI